MHRHRRLSTHTHKLTLDPLALCLLIIIQRIIHFRACSGSSTIVVERLVERKIENLKDAEERTRENMKYKSVRHPKNEINKNRFIRCDKLNL